MELVTIKQYAKEQNISYEAVRKQVVRYAEELSGHITKQDRTQYLDQWAVKFLTEKRRESPIILTNIEQSEELEALRAKVEALQAQLMTAQNELLKEKDHVIALQDEAKKGIEDRVRYAALLEENKAKEEALVAAKEETADLRKQIDVLSQEKEAALTEIQSFSKSFFGFYRKK